MSKLSFLTCLCFIFLISTAFITVDTDKDTTTKPKNTESTIELKPIPKVINVDSVVAVAQHDILEYNKSVEVRKQIDLKLLEQNKRLLQYEKMENELLKKVIKKISTTSTYTLDNKTLPFKVDSIYTKYKHPLFGKKMCIEYSPVYIINKDGKEIKLKEIK